MRCSTRGMLRFQCFEMPPRAVSDARAQPPLSSMEVTCDQVSIETVTFMDAPPSESSFTSTRTWGRVTVDEPRLWMVERCGTRSERDGTVITGNPTCLNDGFTCSGGPPPSGECRLENPEFTDAELIVTCDTTTESGDVTTVSTSDSVRVVRIPTGS